MNKKQILAWLYEKDKKKLEQLFFAANEIRQKYVGNDIHLRGLIEISNYCSRECAYCGIHKSNNSIQRYRMTSKEIIDCARLAKKFKYGTIVMQSGEDLNIKAEWLADIIYKIKKETSLAITLSLGERSYNDFKIWKEAGADRYLLRFETTDPNLYKIIHPSKSIETIRQNENKLNINPRIFILKELRNIGYAIGTGVMVGVPGQTYDTLANDILAFKEIDIDMIGVGPYIEHPDTTLSINKININNQVENTDEMTYKTIALTRLACPESNIPSTTALSTINKKSGRKTGLLCGANIIMPNLTPLIYRSKYEIYPNKYGIDLNAEDINANVVNLIKSIGRNIGIGAGHRTKNHIHGLKQT